WSSPRRDIHERRRRIFFARSSSKSINRRCTQINADKNSDFELSAFICGFYFFAVAGDSHENIAQAWMRDFKMLDPSPRHQRRQKLLLIGAWFDAQLLQVAEIGDLRHAGQIMQQGR